MTTEATAPAADPQKIRDAEGRTDGGAAARFGIFNGRLDFEAGSATVEDELDPDLEETADLESFLDRTSGTRHRKPDTQPIARGRATI